MFLNASESAVASRTKFDVAQFFATTAGDVCGLNNFTIEERTATGFVPSKSSFFSLKNSTFQFSNEIALLENFKRTFFVTATTRSGKQIRKQVNIHKCGSEKLKEAISGELVVKFDVKSSIGFKTFSRADIENVFANNDLNL